MRKLVLILAAMLIAPAGVYAQEKMTDVDGWGKVRWGMTEEQVSAAANDAEKLDKVEQYHKPGGGDDENDRYSSLGTDGIEIAAAKFNVRYLFSSTTKKLVAVFLKSVDENPISVNVICDRLEQALTEKYGPPTFAKRDDNDRRRFSWKRPKTTVGLDYMNLRMLKYAHLVVSYEPTAAISAGADKL